MLNILRWFLVGSALLMIPAFFILVLYIFTKYGVVQYLGYIAIVATALILGFLFCEAI